MGIFQAIRNRFASPAQPAPPAAVMVSSAVHRDDPATTLGNPLRTLTPRQAAIYIEASLRGEWTMLQWVMYWAERLDSDLQALVRLRTAGIGEYVWGIQMRDGIDDTLAKDQKAALEAAYSSIRNLDQVIRHLEMAAFRGYAHVAKAKIGDDWELRTLDQHWWVRHGMYGQWYWNPEAKQTTASWFGDHSGAIDPADYIIREDPLPVIWLAVLKFLRSNYSQKWWDSFCEAVSKQGTVITAPTGLTPDQATQFRSDATAIAKGGSGVLPFGAQVHMTNTMRGAIPYQQHMDKLSRDLMRAAIGGTLALETQSGSGTLAGGAHLETVRTIINASAKCNSECMQEQFDAPLLDQLFPGQKHLAYFELGTREEEDAGEVVSHAVQLAAAGYQMDPQELSQKTGYTITYRGGAPTAEPGADAVLKAAEGAGKALGTNPAASEIIKRNALNGQQVSSLVEIIEKFYAGTLPRESAVNTIKVAFALGEDDAASLVAAPPPAVTPTPGTMKNRARDLVDDVADELQMPADFFAPLAAVLTELEEELGGDLSPEAAYQAVERALARMPELADVLGVDDLADVLEAAMGGAALAGAQDSRRAKGEGQTDA